MDIVAINQQGMTQDMQRLTSVGQNVANMNTPGYKAQVEGVSAFDALMKAQQIPMVTDTHNGKLAPTNSPLDFAILGDGYFQIMTPQGMAYTRAGQFQIDKTGQLQTLTGYPVMGDGGYIVIPHWDEGHPFNVNQQGEIYEAKSTAVGRAPMIAKLTVVQFAAGTAFTPIGHGLLVTEVSPSTNAHPVMIKQGYLEDSNVNQVDNMTAMMSAKNNINDKALTIKNYHQMTQTAINELGEL